MSRRSIRRTRSTLVALAALGAAACADPARVTAPNQLNVSATQNPEFNSTRHLFHTRDYYAKANTGASAGGTGIYYHGGPLIVGTATNVAAVYWSAGTIYNNQPSGTGVGSTDGSLIGFFLSHLGGSPYFNINTTYYNGSNTHVVNAVNYTQFWATGGSYAAPGSKPSDADMVALLQAGFNSGALTYDPNTVYAIFTGNGVNLGGGFGSQYCAYHTHGTVTLRDGSSQTVLYAAMPYNAQYPSGCTSGYKPPNTDDDAANAEVNTLAHEIEETTTDKLGTAWYDRRGYENADKCAWTWGSNTYTTSNGGTANVNLGGKDFLIQQNWVNANSGGCAIKF
jgi:hypothetical protein